MKISKICCKAWNMALYKIGDYNYDLGKHFEQWTMANGNYQ